MNVVILQDKLRGGGTERQSIELTKALQRHSHNAELWVGEQGGTLDQLAEKELSAGPTFLSARSPQIHLATVAILRKKLKALRGPHILVFMGRWSHLVANCLSKTKDARWVSTVRGSRALPWPYLRTIRRSDQLITNSHWALKATEAKLGRGCHPPSKVIHNGLSREALLNAPVDQRGTSNIILNTARLEPGKGQEDLIRALTDHRLSEVSLALLGSGQMLEPLKNLTKELRLSDRVRFHGFREDIASLLSEAAIFVSASTMDSLPNALIEAHAAALPIVAYHAVGIPEIVEHGKTGFLCTEHRPDQLAAYCNKLLTDRSLALSFGTEARKKARLAFDREKQNREFCSALEAIV